MPYRPASHSPDPRAQFPGGAPPVSDPYPPAHHRPQSTYDHPQELGTSVYDSPVDHSVGGQRPGYPPSGPVAPTPHQQFQQQQQPQQDYSPSVYSSEEAAAQHQFPPQQQQQPLPYPNAQAQAPPTHQPPPVPGTAPPQPTQYTAFNPAVAPSGGEYKAYQPPQGGASASNPASFYR